MDQIILQDEWFQLRKVIKSFCITNGLSDSAFGVLVLKDPSFVKRLNSGRFPQRRTQKKIREFILKYEQ